MDSGSQAKDSGFLVLQWNLDSRFHSIAVLQIPRLNSAFQIPEFGFRKQIFPGFQNAVKYVYRKAESIPQVLLAMVDSVSAHIML